MAEGMLSPKNHGGIVVPVSPAHLLSIPTEILDFIITRLPMANWPALALVCKAFRRGVLSAYNATSIVDLTRTALSDAAFAQLIPLIPHATHFHLDAWSLSDSSFHLLPASTTCLEIRDVSRVTSASLAHVAAHCPSLTNLYLSSAQRTASPIHSTVPHTYSDLGVSHVLGLCPNLKHLTLDLPDPHCHTSEDLRTLRSTTLTELHLYIGGHARMPLSLPLEHIRHLPLEALSLCALNLSNFGCGDVNGHSFLRGLVQTFTRLEELYVDLGCYLDYCHVPSDVAELARLTSLKRLHLAPFHHNRKIAADETLRKIISSCTQLEDIFVDITISDHTISQLVSGRPGPLRCLHLAECGNLTDAALNAITTHCSRLESVTLFSSSKGPSPCFSDGAWAAFLETRGPKLYRVVVRNLSLPAMALLAIHCAAIEHLVLRDCHVTDEVLVAVAKNLPLLGFLDIGRNTLLTDKGIGLFARECVSRQLHTISLYKLLKLTDAGIHELARHCSSWSLETLNLNASLTDASILSLATSHIGDTLLDLDVNGMTLTKACVPSLAQFRRLRRLWGLHRHAWLSSEVSTLVRLNPNLIIESLSPEDG